MGLLLNKRRPENFPNEELQNNKKTTTKNKPTQKSYMFFDIIMLIAEKNWIQISTNPKSRLVIRHLYVIKYYVFEMESNRDWKGQGFDG